MHEDAADLYIYCNYIQLVLFFVEGKAERRVEIIGEDRRREERAERQEHRSAQPKRAQAVETQERSKKSKKRRIEETTKGKTDTEKDRRNRI